KLTPVKVKGGTSPEVNVTYEKPADIVVKKGDEQKLEQRISLVPDLEAPVEKGQVLGRVLVVLGASPIAEYTLKAAQAVEKMTMLNGMKMLFGKLIMLI
ncbi:MAG: D-alanyl-D-alanine carboxypeptidase, partial [Hydrogenoanaerobacterium sp.]